MNKILYTGVELWRDDHSECMHLVELGGFLRWADELDCSRERISGIINRPSSAEATCYWDKLDVINNIHIAPGVITICPNETLIIRNSKYYLGLIHELVQKLNKEYETVSEAIQRPPQIVFGQQIHVRFNTKSLHDQYSVIDTSDTAPPSIARTSSVNGDGTREKMKGISEKAPPSHEISTASVLDVYIQINQLIAELVEKLLQQFDISPISIEVYDKIDIMSERVYKELQQVGFLSNNCLSREQRHRIVQGAFKNVYSDILQDEISNELGVRGRSI